MASVRWLLPVALSLVFPSAVHAASAAASANASDVEQAASAGVSSALSSSYSAVLNAGDYGMTCTGSTTTGSDGNTTDTDALIATIAAAAPLSQGAEIMLPTGLCELNEEIDIPVTAPMRFTGAGIGLTKLEFLTPSGASTAVGNGLVFTLSNMANLTIDDFTVSRHLGSDLGKNFIGTAISVNASKSTQAGNVLVDNLSIYGAAAGAQTDSWNTGLLETNIVDPVINDVTVSMPGWGYIPDPGGYVCQIGGGGLPCAPHNLPSPANPVSTPSNLGFGAATGVALLGSGYGNFSIDSVIEGLTVNGGLVGLDLATFQGAYVVDSNFTNGVYGIRADTLGTVSELLSVANSQFTSTTAGIYTNGVGGMQITGNYIQPAYAAFGNLPDWAGIWDRNDNNVTVSDNNIVGSASAAAPEYGIWTSSDGYNGFPVSITGNTIYNLSAPGSVCLGNNVNVTSINATGNNLYACAVYLQDQQGGNAYGSNSFQTPDILDDGHDDVTFPNALQIGTFHSPGSLTIDNFNVQTFAVDTSGNVTANGNLTSKGSITGATLNGSSLVTSGSLVFSGSTGHNLAQQVVGNFYFPGPSNPLTISLNPPSGGFPAPTSGLATMFGELTCGSNNGYIASWRIEGQYLVSNGTPTLSAFKATIEGDADSQKLAAAMGGNFTVAPQANPNALGLQMTFGTAVVNTWDCTSALSEMVVN